VLTATNLGVRLPEGRVLFSGVDVEFRAGEASVIVGPSGVGKSTLLFVLGGLLPPTTGTVTGPASGSCAFVFQGMNGLAARSAIDNASVLAFVDAAERRVAVARAHAELTALGLGDHVGQRANTLSGGELQRLTVARALASDRPLVLADEPTNQLDAANARMVMGRLVEAAGERRCVVIVTHDREAVGNDCRVLRLSSAGLEET
jgi:ABC-type lipoprotein export system ATPase subunit